MKNGIRLIVGAAAGLGVLAGGAGLWLSKTERIVQLIEKKFDCRCELDSVKYSLFQSPVGVKVKGLRIYPRTGNAPPLLDVPRGELKVSGLLSGEAVLEEIALEDPIVTLQVTEQGMNWEMKRDSQKTIGEVAPGPASDSEGESTDEPNDGLKTLRKVTLTNGVINYENSKNDLYAQASQFSLISEDASSGVFTVKGIVTAGNETTVSSFITADTDATVTLATQVGQPDFLIEARFAEGSNISREFPILRKAWELMDKVRDFGLKIKELPESLALKSDKIMVCEINDDQITLRNELPLKTKGWQAVIAEGASFNPETTEHALKIVVGADDKRSAKLKRGYDKIVGKIPGLSDKLEGKLFRDGRLAVEITSHGKLAKPSVKSLNPLPKAKELLQDGVEGLLKGLFRK